MVIIRLDTADNKVHVLSAETIKPFNYFTRVVVDCVTNFLRRTTSRKFINFFRIRSIFAQLSAILVCEPVDQIGHEVIFQSRLQLRSNKYD